MFNHYKKFQNSITYYIFNLKTADIQLTAQPMATSIQNLLTDRATKNQKYHQTRHWTRARILEIFRSLFKSLRSFSTSAQNQSLCSSEGKYRYIYILKLSYSIQYGRNLGCAASRMMAAILVVLKKSDGILLFLDTSFHFFQ